MKKPLCLFPTVQFVLSSVFFLILLSAAGADHGRILKTGDPAGLKVAEARAWLAQQPVEFLENKGQIVNTEKRAASSVLFKAEAPGLDLYVTAKGLSYVFAKYHRAGPGNPGEQGAFSYERLDVELAGASILKENIVMEEAGSASYNYLTAAGPIRDVKKYRRLSIRNVYPGIDWILYNSSVSGFKYDFIVHPGADARQIELLYRSLQKPVLEKNGNLLIGTSLGSLRENAPYSYLAAGTQEVDSRYSLRASRKQDGVYETRLAFELATLPASRNTDLVIDPQLVWSTFYGGTGVEGALGIETDPSGNVYLCGYVTSTDFPLMTAGTYYQSTPSQAFIVKFSNTGALLWSTYFAAGSTAANYLASDHNGNIFLCGNTNSSSFPGVNNNSYYQANLAGGHDAYIAKFDPQGNCTWATLYGGSDNDIAYTVATDPSGNVFLAGTSSSTNLPVQNTGTYFEGTVTGNSSGFIVKFDNAGNRLWASYVKGISIPVVTADLNGNVYIAGQTNTLIPLLNPGGGAWYQGSLAGASDAVILRFDNLGNQVWGTYYGGTGTIDKANNIGTDKSGNVYVSGLTTSADLPVQNSGGHFQATLGGQQDVFLLKFNNQCVRQWGTYFGGSRDENQLEWRNMTLDTCGNIYLAFTTSSRNLALQAACDGGYQDLAIDTSYSAANEDVFITRFTGAGNLVWSSYFGGDGADYKGILKADRMGNVYMSGQWSLPSSQSSYPLVSPAGSYTAGFTGAEDIYISKFSNSLPAYGFSYPPLCTGDTSRLPLLLPGFLTGGSFSASPGGLGINAQSGQVQPGSSAPGNYTVSYHRAPCYCAGAAAVITGSTLISIMAAPDLSVTGANSTMCTGEQLTLTATGAMNYSWSTGAQTATISLAPATASVFSFTITGTAGNGCERTQGLTVTVSDCVGLSEASDNSGWRVYPNPNSGTFGISSEQARSLILLNSLGQVIRQLDTGVGNRLLTVENLPKGIYFLRDRRIKDGKSYKIVVE